MKRDAYVLHAKKPLANTKSEISEQAIHIWKEKWINIVSQQVVENVLISAI